MDSLVCKNCGQVSSVPPSTQQIRCHGCQQLLSVGVPTAGSPAQFGPIHPSSTVQSKSFHCRRSHEFSLELEMRKSGAKNFCHSVKKKFICSANYYQDQSQVWRPPSSSSVPEDSPPRGKRALICGVSYKKQKCELKGTARDISDIKDLLAKEFGFPAGSILVLSEDNAIRPTRENINNAFRWLVRGIQAGDSLVFYYSGHGKRQRDFNGDERDGFDETICPVDFESKGMILDNEINDAIVRPLIPDVTLHAIVDSCHSGTILDLPNVYNITTGQWEDNSPPSGAFKGTSGGKAICFSACEDYQLAADTSAFSQDEEMRGAMTFTFVQAITKAFDNKEKITYQRILEQMHEALKNAHKSSSGGRLSAGFRRMFQRRIFQDPLLSASEEFNTNTEFKP